MRYSSNFAVNAASWILAAGLPCTSPLWAQEAGLDGAETAEIDAPPTGAQPAAADNGGNILADADRTHSLSAKLNYAARLRAFAAEHADDQQVAKFARQTSETLQRQAAILEHTARQHATLRHENQQAASTSDPDLSETVEEIGETVRERLRQRAERRGEAAAAEEPTRVVDEDSRAERPARGAERRDGLRAERKDRDAARERLRILMPALREELPDLFEAFGEAIEDETVGSAAWVDYQRRIAERVLEAKQQELKRYQGQHFDQAFLGMALVEAIELEAIAKTVAEQAPSSLRDAVEAAARELREEAETSRALMDQQVQQQRAEVSSNRSADQPVAK